MLLHCFTDKFWLSKAATQLCDKPGGLTKEKKILGGESFLRSDYKILNAAKSPDLANFFFLLFFPASQ